MNNHHTILPTSTCSFSGLRLLPYAIGFCVCLTLACLLFACSSNVVRVSKIHRPSTVPAHVAVYQEIKHDPKCTGLHVKCAVYGCNCTKCLIY